MSESEIVRRGEQLTEAEHEHVAIQVGDAYRQLARATTVRETKQVVDMSSAIEQYARRIGESIEATNAIVELRLRAERKMGELIPQHYPKGGDRRSNSRGASLKLPVSYDMSRRVQQVAALPAAVPMPCVL